MTQKQLKNFPGAAAVTANDLIYMSQNGIEVAATPAQLAAGIAQNAAREVFVAGTNFTAGTTASLTLAGTYGSINNILVLADATIQTDCTLNGNTLGFNPTVPPGTQQIVVIGWPSRSIGVPADASVTASKIAPGAIDGTKLNVSGAGVLQPTISFAHNPSGLTNWTSSSGQNFEGHSVDVGGYGVRQFGTFPNVTSISGSLAIPSTATTPANGAGVSGYVRNFSTLTNAVALFGQADVGATNALPWGINTVTNDNGFKSTCWGAEFDINLTNVNSAAFGVNVVGGSTVEPTTGTYGVWVGPLGTFSSPPKRWAKGVFVGDASSITGFEMGTANVPGTVAGGSMPMNFFFNPNAGGRQLGAEMVVDSAGNLSLCQTTANAVLALVVGGAAGSGLPAFEALSTGSAAAIGFYGQVPSGKQTVSGSKGGNAALASLMSALSAIGLFTDSTT